MGGMGGRGCWEGRKEVEEDEEGCLSGGLG